MRENGNAGVTRDVSVVILARSGAMGEIREWFGEKISRRLYEDAIANRPL